MIEAYPHNRRILPAWMDSSGQAGKHCGYENGAHGTSFTQQKKLGQLQLSKENLASAKAISDLLATVIETTPRPVMVFMAIRANLY